MNWPGGIDSWLHSVIYGSFRKGRFVRIQSLLEGLCFYFQSLLAGKVPQDLRQ